MSNLSLSAVRSLTEALKYEWDLWARPTEQREDGTWTGQKMPPGDWSTWLIMAGRGYGKALANNTPIATPSGWKNISEIKRGDSVFDENGAICDVTGVFPQGYRLAWRISFSDGSNIVADAEHLWITEDTDDRLRATRARWQLKIPITTAQIRDYINSSHKTRAHQGIRVCNPLILPFRALPVPPYVLGLWLGDGESTSGRFSSTKEDAKHYEKRFAEYGLEWVLQRSRNKNNGDFTTKSGMIRAKSGRFLRGNGLSTALKEMGVIKNKHIPGTYLRASIAQRLDLLRGLMDSDGHVDKMGNAVFNNNSDALCGAVMELVRTLGGKPVLTRTPSDKKWRYRVRWKPHIPPVSLPRKMMRCRALPFRHAARYRYIKSVDFAGIVPMTCIAVNSEHNLFLAGEALIPTHNTRLGAETVRYWVEKEGARRIALVGRTVEDVRDVMVRGMSGLLSVFPPSRRPVYIPSQRLIQFPNGAQAKTFSSERPDRLRGPNHDRGWADEIASWHYAQDTWDNLSFSMRIKTGGHEPRIIATTTPRPIPLVKNLIADKDTVVTTGSTYENRANLSQSFFTSILRRYRGTRLGLQEIFARILDDVQGAIWKYSDIEETRVDRLPRLLRIVIGVDPAVTYGDTSSETGIIVAGIGDDDHAYILADHSIRDTPMNWAKRVVETFGKYSADRVIVEVNQGGDLVEHTLKSIDEHLPITKVRASRGKQTRAEPISALYEQRKVHHAGVFKELEEQMTSWVPGDESPDRMDALVWCLYDLMPIQTSPIEPMLVRNLFEKPSDRKMPEPQRSFVRDNRVPRDY